MASTTYKSPRPNEGEKAVDFWGRIAGDQSYSQGQRDFATDKQRFEQGVVGSEREGLSYRNFDQFDSMYQPPPGNLAPQHNPNAVSAPPLQDAGNGAISAPPLQSAGEVVPIDHRTWTGADDLNKIQPGAAVTGKPGWTWGHNGTGWFQTNGAAGGAGAAAPGGPPGGGSSSAPGVTAPGLNPATVPGALSNDQAPGGETSTLGTQDIFRDTLIQLMGQNPAPSISDPSLRPAAEAFRHAQERARSQKQAALVERDAARGLARSGALDSEIAQTYDDMGQATSQFEAQLVMNELKDRRQQVMQALQMGGAVLDSDLNRRLQKQLAEIDAALRREGYGVQTTLGQGDLSLRDKLGTGNLNLGLLGLLMQDKHFGQDLGFKIGSKEADLNNMAMQLLLSGGD